MTGQDLVMGSRMEWSLDEDNVVSGGPVEEVKVGSRISWDMDSK